MKKEYKVNLNNYNNLGYAAGKNIFVVIAWFIANSIFLQTPFIPFSFLKVALLKLFGAKIGKKVRIKPSVNIKYPWNLYIGDNTWIGEKVWIDSLGKVHICNNVCISQGAMLLCGSHEIDKCSFDIIVDNILIEDGAWVGARSIVGPGVTLHSHAVLNINSVAVKDLEPYFIYQGNPAVKIRKRVLSG